MIDMASSSIGAVVGLIVSAMFAVILQQMSLKNPEVAVKALRNLIGIVLGFGLSDYVVFQYIMKSNGFAYYLIGLAGMFLPIGGLVFLSWWRSSYE